jgi:hypothetical protein
MNKASWLTVALLGLASSAQAATITFDDDPFAGSTALTTPGRQIVAGEPSDIFDSANDVFEFNEAVFGVGALHFANGEIGSIPEAGTNFAVLRTFDNDNNTATPFGAGNAANLLADRITTPGAGFFIYFNSGLDLARLVFSTDLSDATADLKILTRLTNFSGQAGREALAGVSAGNAAVATAVPAPATGALLLIGLGALCLTARRRKQPEMPSLTAATAA